MMIERVRRNRAFAPPAGEPTIRREALTQVRSPVGIQAALHPRRLFLHPILAAWPASHSCDGLVRGQPVAVPACVAVVSTFAAKVIPAVAARHGRFGRFARQVRVDRSHIHLRPVAIPVAEVYRGMQTISMRICVCGSKVAHFRLQEMASSINRSVGENESRGSIRTADAPLR
jgi:hypothetical protein